MTEKGILFIVSAPSGAGKTTLCNNAALKCRGVKLSVSYTTRKPRQGEIDGVHYFFVKESVFKEMISKGEFLEWARVHDNLYGTSKSRIDEMVAQGFDVLLDIDVQGGRQIKEKIPESILIFILPPSMEVLKDRLRKRMSDTEDVIIRRLDRAQDEIREYKYYDYVIVNDDLEYAAAQLKSVIAAERASVSRVNHNWIAKNFLQEKN
jgi:guanylate kinase